MPIYAILENNTPRELARRESPVVGGVTYPANITALWSPEELANLGIYEILEPTARPEGRWHDDVASTMFFADGTVTRQWSGTYNPAKHLAAKLEDSRNQFEIPRIDAATGDVRAKLTLIAGAVADIIQRLATIDPATFGTLATHLAPWAEVIAIQTKGAAIEAALAEDPTLDLAEAWQAE